MFGLAQSERDTLQCIICGLCYIAEYGLEPSIPQRAKPVGMPVPSCVIICINVH